VPAALFDLQQIVPDGHHVATGGRIVATRGRTTATRGRTIDTRGRTIATRGRTIATGRHTIATDGRTIAPRGRNGATAGDTVATAGHNGDMPGRTVDTRGSSRRPPRSSGDPEVNSRASKLVEALVEWRTHAGKSQADTAERLSISRRVYALFEAGRWLPPHRERHFFAHTLHALDPRLGDGFARACGTTGEALGLPKPALVSAPSPAQARAAYDAAVYSAAEETEVPPRTARALVAAALTKLHEAGVAMDQAEGLGRRA
jgi:transcriptional regulator with XRE-family HTH domain/uncharacterized Zn-binding protein involved in type VI secretion